MKTKTRKFRVLHKGDTELYFVQERMRHNKEWIWVLFVNDYFSTIEIAEQAIIDQLIKEKDQTVSVVKEITHKVPQEQSILKEEALNVVSE